ncbi:hypothetical protein ACOQNS_04760, partial [Pseudomonas asiatica]
DTIALNAGVRKVSSPDAYHVEKPLSAHWWAAYCIKEYTITASMLEAGRRRKSRPDYATQKLTQAAKAFYGDINAWLNTGN